MCLKFGRRKLWVLDLAVCAHMGPPRRLFGAAGAHDGNPRCPIVGISPVELLERPPSSLARREGARSLSDFSRRALPPRPRQSLNLGHLTSCGRRRVERTASKTAIQEAISCGAREADEARGEGEKCLAPCVQTGDWPRAAWENGRRHRRAGRREVIPRIRMLGDPTCRTRA